ncbi:MAG: DUF3160 domain-containing protein [Patescibacteria group bacterium]
MPKKRLFSLYALIIIVVAAGLFLILRPHKYTPTPIESNQSSQGATSTTEALNEPNIGFTPTYQENATPLAQVPNYEAIKAKYGLTLSPAQEKYLDKNRFLLINYDSVPFFKSGLNFDQWLVDSDRMGGGSIYNRKPEDSVLVTPDTVLHAYHKYFELTLEELEQHELSQALGDFLTGLHANLATAVKDSQGEIKTRYQNLEAQIVLAQVLFENKNAAKPSYFNSPDEEVKYSEADKTIDSLANANLLLTKYSSDLTPELINAIKSDLTEIYAAKNIGASPLFKQYDEQIKTDYTQFTPRSHYAKNSTLRAYFRTMMYLGRSSYLLHSDLAIADTNLLVKQMALKNGAAAPLDSWQKITTITDFYAGQSDDLTYPEWQAYEASQLGANTNSDAALTSADNIAKLKANLDKLRKPKILSDVIIDENIAARDKASLLNQSLSFRVFGQKFSFDASILNDLTAGQEKTEVKLPSMPSALFVPAVLGDLRAETYVAKFLETIGFNAAEVAGFTTKLELKKTALKTVPESDWYQSLGSSWLYVLGALTHNYGVNYPLYMQSRSFLDKQIQTFLGSYAELKHDTLLYAKQSYAELGAGGEDQPLPPIVKGFVEPNLEFLNRFNKLIERTETLYTANNLFTNQSAMERLGQFKKISALYTKIAEAELRGQAISDDDYETLRTTKLAFMAQPFEAVDPTETSGQTALIADIHTDMVSGQILYEATAKPYLMLAIVGNENAPRVVAGLVYNHYELTDPIGTRLTDENWRNRVYKDNSLLPAKNFWYDSILVK